MYRINTYVKIAFVSAGIHNAQLLLTGKQCAVGCQILDVLEIQKVVSIPEVLLECRMPIGCELSHAVDHCQEPQASVVDNTS